MPTWSYSALKMFQSCPRKYYHIRVVKDVGDEMGTAGIYGNDAHKAAEKYIGKGVPLPEKYGFMQEQLDKLKSIPGEKHCELRVGLTQDMVPCGYWDKNIWFRGAIDLLILNREKKMERMIDYKFGKSAHADTSQLELMALAVFKLFPEIERVKAGLLFCAEELLIPTEYRKADEQRLWVNWEPEVARIDVAHKTNVWNTNPSGLCRKHCPVLNCEHNGRG